jgi:hypothetical protein
VRSVVHPDPATVHDLFCQNLVLQGVCEYYVEEGLDGGPYLMVRVEPDQPPILVALKNIESLDPHRHAHE